MRCRPTFTQVLPLNKGKSETDTSLVFLEWWWALQLIFHIEKDVKLVSPVTDDWECRSAEVKEESRCGGFSVGKLHRRVGLCQTQRVWFSGAAPCNCAAACCAIAPSGHVASLRRSAEGAVSVGQRTSGASNDAAAFAVPSAIFGDTDGPKSYPEAWAESDWL
jgi:hypothetical protein